MSSPLATALTLLVGITLCATVNSLFNAYYRPQWKMHLYFALICLFGCGYVVTRLYNIHTQSVEGFILAHRLGICAAILLFVSQIGFITEYSQWRPRWMIASLLGILLTALLANIFLPHGLAYFVPPELRPLTLPWGEVVNDTRFHEKTLWWRLGWLGIIGVFLLQFAAAFRLRKAGDVQQGDALFWFGGVFFLVVISNLLIQHFVVQFIQMAEFGLVAMILLMSLHLNREVRSTRLRAESAEGMWSSLVMNAPNFVLLVDGNGIIQFINHVLPGDVIEDAIGKSIDQFLSSESLDSIHTSLQQVITSKAAMSTQLQLAPPRHVWLDVQLAPLFVDDKLEHIIIIATDISENIAIRNKLQQSEARYRQLLQTLPNGVREIDRAGRITFSNRAHDELFGYDAGQMLGMSIFDLPATQQEVNRLRDYIQHIFADHPVPEIYTKQDKKNNAETVSIQIDWDYVYDDDGNTIGLLSVLTDITRQHQAQQALRDSDAKFRQLADNINQVFFIRDLASNRMLYVSPAYETIWGKCCEELYADSMNFVTSIHPDDKARVLDVLKQQNVHGKLFNTEYRIIDTQGDIHWVYARTYPILDESGKLYRVTGIVEDITQRKLIEIQLHNAKASLEQRVEERTAELTTARDLLKNVIDSTPDWIFVKDTQHRFLLVNKSYAAAQGLTPEQMHNRPDSDFWPAELCEGDASRGIRGFHDEDREVLAGNAIYVAKYPLQQNNGREQFFDRYKGPLRDAQGEVYGVLLFARDITERVAAEQALLLKDAAIENSLNGAAITDLQGKLIYVNQAFLNMWGYACPDEVLDTLVSDHWQDPSEAMHIIQQLRAHQHWRGQLWARRKDGSGMIVELAATVPLDELGNPTHMFGSFIDVTQRVTAERQQRISHQLLDAVFDNTHVLIAVLDTQMNFIRVNRAYAAADGKAPEDFIGKNHFQLFPHTENERLFREAALTGKPQQVSAKPFEYAHSPERDVSHWDWTLTPVSKEDGRVAQLVLSLLDVTDRIEALQDISSLNETLEQRVCDRTHELEASYEFTEAVVNTVGAVVMVMDKAGRIVRFNHACEYITGYEAAQCIGRRPWDFLLPQGERSAAKQVFAKLRASQFPRQYENYWLHKAGEKRLIAWSDTCITDPQGEVEFVIGTGVDITEQRRAEEALRDSAEKYRALMEYASDVILIADHSGKLVEANSRGLALLGYTHEEITSLRVNDIHPPHQLLRISQAFKQMLECGTTTVIDTSLLAKNGEEFPVDINANLIEYQGEKVAVGFMRDITMRKETEALNRQQEQRHREMLVREVHHRIKNNLQGVIGLLRNSLQEDLVSNKHILERAIGQVSTIAMVHGLQGRIGEGAVKLCDITRAIVLQCRGLAPDDVNIEFQENMTSSGFLDELESIPMALVINELVTNAVKHIPVSSRSKQVIVELKGNPQNGMELRVFNARATLPKDLKKQSGAETGVGLEMVRALLPRKHATFSLSEDSEAGGVYASLRFEAELFSEIPVDRQSAALGDLPG